MKLIYAGVLVVYVLGFGILFGFHTGIMGDLVHWDLHTKTKLLNSLAIFGYFSLGGAAVLAVRKTQDDTPWLAIVAILLIMAVSYSFVFVDCAIFNFCGEG